MASNEWVLVGGKWYRFEPSGRMLENQWFKDYNGWYWLKSGGAMASNETLIINGITYKFLQDGRLV